LPFAFCLLIFFSVDFELINHVYRVTALKQFDWLDHGFGTRYSEPPGAVATLRQIHSDIIMRADRAVCLGEGDALLSDTPGLRVGVKTADCFPILLVDARHRAVGAVHAGWRGIVRRIAHKTVDAMAIIWSSRPDDLHAAIGPGIGPCCFEVGPEVAVQFGQPAERARIDLPEAVRLQLIEAGLRPERIYTAGLCTVCRAAEFHSFRRDREKAGRMISVIGVKSSPRNN
jgi:YfiH family protein